MAGRRVERVAEAIKEEISVILQTQVKDPRIGFLTVTAAKLSDDLRHAKIFISVYGNDEEKEKALKGLRSATRFIRGEIGKRVKLRCTPEIFFKLDNSLEKATHIDDLLRQIDSEKNG